MVSSPQAGPTPRRPAARGSGMARDQIVPCSSSVTVIRTFVSDSDRRVLLQDQGALRVDHLPPNRLAGEVVGVQAAEEGLGPAVAEQDVVVGLGQAEEAVAAGQVG